MRTIRYFVLSALTISGLTVSGLDRGLASGLASNSVAIAHLSLPSTAQSLAPGTDNPGNSGNSGNPATLAQLEGQCRLVNRSMGIYEEPRTSSRSFGIVAENQVVVLGDGSGNSWARIVSPRIGWVDARNLRVIDCPPSLTRPNPPTSPSVPESAPDGPAPMPPVRPSDRCTVVIYDGEEGLGIYSSPSSSSRSLGSLPVRSRVYLTGDTSIEPTGRQWVEIVSNSGDDYGWIPETGPTGPDSGYNIRTLACANIVGEIVAR